MEKTIYVSEKRISVEYAWNMLRKGKIIFPEAPVLFKPRRTQRVTEIVELILLGAAVPAVYVSELQDGRWLILESSDRLRALFLFLNHACTLEYMDTFPEYSGMSVTQLETEVPRVTSKIMNHNLQFQVIDYMTPKYLHLQIGKCVERWGCSREQGIRNALYQNYDAIVFLKSLANKSYGKNYFFSSSTLNRQYAVLQIYMYRFVFQKMIQSEEKSMVGMQFLIDQTIEQLNTLIEEHQENFLVDEFEAVTESVVSMGMRDAGFKYFSNNRGKEIQIRCLSYVYNLYWLVLDGCIAQERCNEILCCGKFWERIEKDDVNYNNISHHYDMILKGKGMT